MEIMGKLPRFRFWAMFHEFEQQATQICTELPAVTLRGWEGKLSFGNWQLDPPNTAIIHGKPKTGPYFQVCTTRDDAKLLAQTLWMMGAPSQMMERMRAPRPRADTKATVSLDGVPLELNLWTDDGGWYAFGVAPTFNLALAATRFALADVQLRTITDIEPYLHLQRQHIARLRGEA
ncbi:hypothetical protein BJ994_002307 [Arthrobacter pigmenti]|uniref:Uncharacterized protein n=1 Tax=Arthrobacter pigmenti TaxID=271432 RepID=A0A846RYF0_9MICC|nr:hypothetical protein [Arthrobacter pigmenti]NJC23231.1 hypothetical protein [Arthrobacter pigmenti]